MAKIQKTKVFQRKTYTHYGTYSSEKELYRVAYNLSLKHPRFSMRVTKYGQKSTLWAWIGKDTTSSLYENLKRAR